MRRSLALVLVLLAAICATAASSGRLVEKPLQLPNYVAPRAAANGVPIVDPPRRTAGYFKLNRTHDAHMFYMFFESRRGGRHDPLLLWMTGGPGCSSEIAIFYENGPYALTKNLTLVDNPYGWDTGANVIFVDQPINTGFSWSDDPRDIVSSERQVADDMLDFLQEFLEAHPEFATRDFFVSGESYAGHYAPAVANRVYRAAELGEGPPINLKGVAIGNGLTQPAVQFGAYADYALQEGVIKQATRDAIQWWYPLCRWGANFCSEHKWGWFCGLTLNYCQMTVFSRILMNAPGINVYDIRKTCEGPLCYDFSDADAYLNSAGVRAALGVGDRAWTECNMIVHAAFYGDFMRDFSTKLVPLLEDGVRVMIYAGDRDLICNWLGNRRWVDQLEWRGKAGWAEAAERPWRAAGGQAGTVTSADTLSFVKVFGAGHMVPMDKPAQALDMITRFMAGKDLGHEEAAAAEELVAGQQQQQQQQQQLAEEEELGEAALLAALEDATAPGDDSSSSGSSSDGGVALALAAERGVAAVSAAVAEARADAAALGAVVEAAVEAAAAAAEEAQRWQGEEGEGEGEARVAVV